MKNHPIKIDELRPIVKALNNKEITWSKAIDLIAESANEKGYSLPMPVVRDCSICGDEFTPSKQLPNNSACRNCHRELKGY